MATLLEQIANIQSLYEDLEALAFGDENTSATHNGQTRDSLAKAIKGKFDALQAMVQGRLTYETKAAMDSAGAPPAGELAEVWNDSTLENNGLYGWDGSGWVASGYDPKKILSGDIAEAKSSVSNTDDSLRIASQIKSLPLTNNSLDFIWAVKANDKILGYFDSVGKWHSDHDHEGLPTPAVLTESVDMIWGVASNGLVLGYFDSAGKWHSDHDHDEFQQLQDQINSQQSQIDNINVTGASASDYLVREDNSGATTQIIAHDGAAEKQITVDGHNWQSPVVHHQNIVRCFSDYTTSILKPHTILPTGEIIPEQQVLMQQLVTGQSLSLGSRGYVIDPAGPYTFDSDPVGVGRLFTPSCPDEFTEHCLTLNNGVRRAGTTLVPSAELPDGVLGETVCSSYMIALASVVRDKSYGTMPRLAAAISGTGGVPYDSLKKGTSVYSGALARITEIKNAAELQGWQHVVSHVRIIHGESQAAAVDPIDYTEDGYAAVLRKWVSDYQADISLITGQSNVIPGVVCQMNTGAFNAFEIPLAQLKAANENDDIILIGPKYQYPYHDEAHMLAEGYVKLGEQESRVLLHWMAGRKWQPLAPESVSLSGTTVTIELNNADAISDDIAGAVGDIVLDTTLVSDPGNYGFELTDENISITSVTVIDSNHIAIELSGQPAVGSYLHYALHESLANAPAGPRGRGCIRDSDTRLISRFDNDYVYNWLVSFRHQF